MQACKAAATTDTSAASRVPTGNIFCTEATLQDAIRAYFRATSTQVPNDPANPPPRFRLCETAPGAPVDPRDLVVAALIGQVRRVVVDSAGRVINLGRRSRLFVGAAREAVLLSGDRCCWPGCDTRAGRIQIDHLSGWATLGGATNPHNGGPECPAHNRSTSADGSLLNATTRAGTTTAPTAPRSHPEPVDTHNVGSRATRFSIRLRRP